MPWLATLGSSCVAFARRYKVPALRLSLGVVFLWFGALKILGVSPVSDFVAKTAYFLPPAVAIVGTGVIEVVIGLGLLIGWGLTIVGALPDKDRD